MMRFAAMLLICLPALAAASAPVERARPVDAALRQARAEARAADAEVRRLERAASAARSEADRLRAEQAAAGEAMAAAEARITAAVAETRMISASLAERRRQLLAEQQPLSSLLGGLAMMARRPPLLALADGSSTDEYVQVRLLLDSTLPVIRTRTAALSSQLREGEQLRRAAAAARNDLIRSRDELARRTRQFASLEAKALQLAAASGSGAISAGDLALALNEDADRLSSEAERNREAARTASKVALLGPAPWRPGFNGGQLGPPPIAYRLPADAPVTVGLGEISQSGVRSRGLTLATRRGAAVAAPAQGVIRFAGPFRDYDGVVIIDHGGGWMSLIIGIASQLTRGERVEAGAPLGRALGPIGVELSRNGQHWSPALIAGSSAKLSKGAKGG